MKRRIRPPYKSIRRRKKSIKSASKQRNWNLGRSQEKTNKDISKGIGLAMLSRVLGIKKIEDNL